MKVKIKFDQKALLDFLLQHVEKIVLGVFVLVFLLMVYSALTSAARFGKTPEQLQSQAATGRREIEATESNTTGLVAVDYTAAAKRGRDPIAAKPYATPTVWDPPLFATRRRRGEPPLLTVQQLRGIAGLGAFRATASSTPAGSVADSEAAGASRSGESTQGKRWIVLTGLVPIEQQAQAFVDAFRTSSHYDSQQDTPVYYGYWVERVEVPEGGSASEPDWTKATTFVSKAATDEALQQWGGSAQSNDVVATQYLVPDASRLTFPLGPLVGRSWGAAVAHAPEIPLISSGTETQVPPGAGETESTRRSSTEKPSVDSPFGIFDAQNKDESRAPENSRSVAVDNDKNPPYRLFRFFDFSVQPGKQYRYRVRLALANPNYGLRLSLLVNPELAKEPFLKTQWSDPTPAIASAENVHILAVSVKPASAHPGSEPSGQILISSWLEKTGDEVFKEFSVVRGQVANFSDVDATLVISGASEKTNMITNSVIVDMDGGQRFTRRRDAPAALGRILLLDASGRLSVCDEAKDAELYKQLTTAAKEATAEQRGLDEESKEKPKDKRRTRRVLDDW